MKENKDSAKDSSSLSAAATQGSYGATTVQDKSDAVPCCALTLYIMMFLGGVCAASLRTSLSEAIVAMVNQTAAAEDVVSTSVSIDGQCPHDREESKHSGGELNWSREEQTVVLAAFYYGHLISLVCISLLLNLRRSRSQYNRYIT